MGEMERFSGLIEDSMCRLFGDDGAVAIAGSFCMSVPFEMVGLVVYWELR